MKRHTPQDIAAKAPEILQCQAAARRDQIINPGGLSRAIPDAAEVMCYEFNWRRTFARSGIVGFLEY